MRAIFILLVVVAVFGLIDCDRRRLGQQNKEVAEESKNSNCPCVCEPGVTTTKATATTKKRLGSGR